jgi:hypothetical protein
VAAPYYFIGVTVTSLCVTPTQKKKGLDFSRPFTYLAPRPGLEPGTYGLLSEAFFAKVFFGSIADIKRPAARQDDYLVILLQADLPAYF